jgi:hypothetical protein
MLNRTFAAVLLFTLAACGGGNDGGGSPTGPTPTTATRIITITGDLTFGPVSVGASANRSMRIANSGTDTLTVTGMTGPNGYTASWTSGAIPPGGSQDVAVRFSPTEPRSYDGRLTVNGNHTSGINTISLFGNGDAPPWTMSGTGNTVFDMPTRVSRVKITGTYTGFSSNFIIRVGGRKARTW